MDFSECYNCLQRNEEDLLRVREGDFVRFRWFSLLAVTGAVLLLAATAWRFLPNADRDAPRDSLVQFLPWILIAVAASVVPFVKPTAGILLSSATAIVIARLSGPTLVQQLPNVAGDDSLSQIFWLVNESDADATWVQSLLSTSVLAPSLLVVAGCSLLLAAVGVLVLELRELLFSRPERSSFAIDVTLLVTLVILAGLAFLPRSTSPNLAAITDLLLGDGSLFASVHLLAWLLPLGTVLALFCRQGGSSAVGASAGAVIALLAIPIGMNVLAEVVGGPSSYFVPLSADRAFPLTAYEVLDLFGASPVPGVIAAVLLLVTLWWAFAAPSSEPRRVRVAGSGAPVNWLSVSAFVVALIPFTAIGGIVLGHMSYDQVTSSKTPVRGIGLSRWAIVLSYGSLLLYPVLVANYFASTSL